MLRAGVSVQALRVAVCQESAFGRLGVTRARASRLAQVCCGILIDHGGSDNNVTDQAITAPAVRAPVRSGTWFANHFFVGGRRPVSCRLLYITTSRGMSKPIQVLAARAMRYHSNALRLLQLSQPIQARNKASCLCCPGLHESS